VTLINSPERIIRGFGEVPQYIYQIDQILGEESVREFAKRLSKMLSHVENDELFRLIGEPGGTSAIIHIITSVAEFQTAWNVLRLASVPAAHRQSRVAMETGAFAVLLALPREKLLGLPKKLAMVKCLKENPSMHLEDLYSPSISTQGSKITKTAPLLRGNAIYPAFLAAAREILNIPQNVVENLRDYHRDVQHPASHSSVELWLHHLDGLEKIPLAGAYFSPERVEIYQQTAADLINLAGWMEAAIGAAEGYLLKRE